MKFRLILENILLEASKKDILVNKVGIDEQVAEAFTQICGSLSLVLFNKALEAAIKINTERPEIYNMSGLANYDGNTLKEKLINYINHRRNGLFDIFGGRQSLVGLMDYIRIGLYGNFREVQDLTLNELMEKSNEWHESLKIGDSKIDFIEKNNIILDFRENGEGFYWADLGKTNCSDEAERMGHCARSSGILFSLRNYVKMQNGHTLNKSHLTASIRDGTLLQLKGPKNSKPKNTYHKYIIALLMFKKNDGEFLIKKTSSEYDKSSDFSINELSDSDFIKLYEIRPDLYKKTYAITRLRKLGVFSHNFEKIGTFNFTILVEDLFNTLFNNEDNISYDLDWLITINTDSNFGYGRDMNDLIYISKSTLNDFIYYDNWADLVRYFVNNINEEEIYLILKNRSLKYDETFDDSLDLIDVIKQYDYNDEIKEAILVAELKSKTKPYYEYLIKKLNTLGKIQSINGREITFQINFFDQIYEKHHEILDEIFDECGSDFNDRQDIGCILYYLFDRKILKKIPFNVGEDVIISDDDIKYDFNEILNDLLIVMDGEDPLAYDNV